MSKRGSVAVWAMVAWVAASASVGAEWRTTRHSSDRFSFAHPAEWKAEESDRGWLSVCAVEEDGPCLFVSAYRKDGTLAEFSKLRLAVEADKYKPLAEPRAIESNGWLGVVQEGEGRALEHHTHVTRRVMLCAGKKDLFVSMTLYTSPADYAENTARYDKVFRSLVLSPEAQ